jgi:hypothetical protein
MELTKLVATISYNYVFHGAKKINHFFRYLHHENNLLTLHRFILYCL